ncbi:hypothetical protein KIW84_030931 [Lathyrus oleraceus]|uniref:Ribulose bisphosphate carboxylase large chain n=1 Tax=Pisum sativum TaxID=3888 RepID=A0A9D4XTP9_PEA|nr:hypothetical protein KIW84_030931 [Pisum sativum]
MSPQTKTKAKVGFKAGVKDYKLTYYTPDYQTKDTDILAAFQVTPQPGVPPEEAGAAVAAESSTGTWTTVWTDGLTSLDRYKGRCYEIEPVPGEDNKFIAYVAYPLDLFEEGYVTNMFTSIVGNVFGFKALHALRLEDLRIPYAYVKTFQGPRHGIQVERDKLNKLSYFSWRINPLTGGLWLTDIAHHHLAIEILFLIAGHMYRTNWGIGHGIKDILEAHKGPFTGQGHKAKSY